MSRRACLAIALLALLARGSYEWALHGDRGPAGALAGSLLGDERAYDAAARRIAAGTDQRTRAFYQAPLYPWLLGQLERVWPAPEVEGSPAALPAAPVHQFVFVLQHLLGVLVALLSAALGARALGPRVGLMTGLMAALSGPLVFHEAMLLKSVLSLCVVLVALLLWLDLLEGSGGWRVPALGLSLGLGVLLRGNLLLLAGLVVLSLWLPLGASRRQPVRGLAVLLFALLAISPATISNLRHGDLVLSTYQSGSNAAIGNPAGDDPLAGLVYAPLRAGRGDARYEEQDAVALAQAGAGRTLNGREVSAWWWRQVAGRVARHPDVALERAALKLLHLFHASETPDVKDWAFLSRAVPWLASPLSTLLLFGPLALLGLMLLPWRGRPGLLVVRGALGVVALSLMIFYVMGRYRLTALPCLWILAAGMLDRWASLWREGGRLRLGLEALLAAGLLGLQLALPLPSDPNGDHVSYANAASVALMRAGLATDPEQAAAQRDQAVGWARRAVDIAPAFPAARRTLVLAESATSPVLAPQGQQAWQDAWRLLLLMEELRTGQSVAAAGLDAPLEQVAQQCLALLDRPSRPSGDAFAGPLLAWAAGCVAQELRNGESQQTLALRLIDAGLRLVPDDPLARAQRGLFLKRLGRLTEAEAAYRRALDLGGDSAELHNNLGSVLLSQGRHEEARACFERALRLAPGNPRILRNLERTGKAPEPADATGAEPRGERQGEPPAH